MQFQVKRFSRKAPIHTIFALALLGASISLKLQNFNPKIQFITVFFLLVSSTAAAYAALSDKIFDPFFSGTIGLIAIALNPLSGALTAAVVSLFFVLLYFFDDEVKLYILAVLSHLLDMISTFILVPRNGEANKFMKLIFEQFGIVPGLILSKFLLVFLPLIYSYMYMSEGEKVLFVKLVAVIGLSIGCRNLMILF